MEETVLRNNESASSARERSNRLRDSFGFKIGAGAVGILALVGLFIVGGVLLSTIPDRENYTFIRMFVALLCVLSIGSAFIFCGMLVCAVFIKVAPRKK